MNHICHSLFLINSVIWFPQFGSPNKTSSCNMEPKREQKTDREDDDHDGRHDTEEHQECRAYRIHSQNVCKFNATEHNRRWCRHVFYNTARAGVWIVTFTLRPPLSTHMEMPRTDCRAVCSHAVSQVNSVLSQMQRVSVPTIVFVTLRCWNMLRWIRQCP